MRTLVLAGLGLALLTACGPKAERPAPTDSLPAATPQARTDSTPSTAAVAPTKPEPAPAPATQPTAVAPQKPAPTPTPKPAAAATTPAPKPATAPAPSPAAEPTATTAAADPYHPAPRDTLDADTYQGWKQYELNCSRCHGEYAVGTSFAPALVVSLKEGGTIPDEATFITTVCAGRIDKGMPSWCALGLEMDKIQWIYKYAKGRADGKYAPGRPAQRQ
jgi:mono/diheme cytochrome c family protein